MTITIQINRNDDTRSLALERTPSYTEMLGISKQLFGIKDAEKVSLKVRDEDLDDLVAMSSSMELQRAVSEDTLQIFVTDLRKSGSLPRPSSSAPSTPTHVPTTSSTAPSASTSKSAPTTPAKGTMLTRLYELLKYMNVPDVLHGLENFGYVTSDQGIEIFELLQQLTVLYPELARIWQYEDHERPICTVRHEGVTCNVCLTKDISGTRYKCAICPDFDMCEKCERKGLLSHDITHPRIKMLVPSTCAFEHSCKSFNSQGEKNDEVTCPFTNFTPRALSPSTVYEKRQTQFNALYKRKQLREAIVEQHRKQQQEEIKEQSRNRKGVLWGYFDNLKKQNKYQSIVKPSQGLDASTSSVASVGNVLSSSVSSLNSSGPVPNSLTSSALSVNPDSLACSTASTFSPTIPTFRVATPTAIDNSDYSSSSPSNEVTTYDSPVSSSSVPIVAAAPLSASTGVCSTGCWTTEDNDSDHSIKNARISKINKICELADSDEIPVIRVDETQNVDSQYAARKDESGAELPCTRMPSSRLNVQKPPAFQINSPDCSPMFPKQNLDKSAFSPVFASSGLRNSRTFAIHAHKDIKGEKVEDMEDEKEEPESDECQDSSEYADDECSESGNSSDVKPASPTPMETDSINVLNEMGFNQSNGDILTTIRKKRGDLFSTIRELLN